MVHKLADIREVLNFMSDNNPYRMPVEKMHSAKDIIKFQDDVKHGLITFAQPSQDPDPVSPYKGANIQDPVLETYLIGQSNLDFISDKVFRRFPVPKKIFKIPEMLHNEHLHLLDPLEVTSDWYTSPNYFQPRQYNSATAECERFQYGLKTNAEEMHDYADTGAILSQYMMDLGNRIQEALDLLKEWQGASLLMNAGSYAAGHTTALTGADCWNTSTGTPLTDIIAAIRMIKKIAKKTPNTLVMGYNTAQALKRNPEIIAEFNKFKWQKVALQAEEIDLQTIFSSYAPDLKIIVGEAEYIDDAGDSHYVWGDFCSIQYNDDAGYRSQGFCRNFLESNFPKVYATPFLNNTYYQHVRSYLQAVVVNTSGYLFTNCDNNGGIY